MQEINKQHNRIHFFLLSLLMALLPGCVSTVKDIEGNRYKTVTIGAQEWMAENLKTTIFSDGTEIPLVDDNNTWAKLTTPAYSSYFNDQKGYKNTYGALYNWYAVSSGKLCPVGWHVASEEDWNVLIINQDGLMKAGGRLKEKGTAAWKIPNTDATNETGFTALPGGYRSFEGAFNYIGVSGYWWTSTAYNESSVVFWNLRFRSGTIYKYRGEKVCGFSVRCIKNIEIN
jgi:uncharacterized protein (TIGR02145 family)